MENSTSTGRHWTDTWDPSTPCSPDGTSESTLQGAIERLQLDIKGSLGRLDPLAGANLSLKLQHPDIGKMLENLRLPVVATGTLNVDARLKDAGKLTQLDVDAKLGDITAKSNGTLRSLGLPGSDLRFEVAVADVARLAKVFDVDGVPAEALTVSGRVASTPEEIKLDGVSATLAGAQLTADGTIRVARERAADFRFELGVENLMRLRKGLPELPLSISGNIVDSRDKLELKNLRSRIGKTEISGWASMARKGKKHIEADLASPHLDLTALSKKEADSKATDEVGRRGERLARGRERACEKAQGKVRLQRRAHQARRTQACRCEAALRRQGSEARHGNAEGRRWHAGRRRRSTRVRGTREGRHRG